jgi:RND family efflux transporter MFP subunit
VLDPATRTMLVEIDLPNPDGRILPGFYGRTEIALERRDSALALPSAAVRTDGGNSYVYVIAADDTVRRAAVTTGLQDGGWIEIESGLNGDERVVAGTPSGLAEGVAVRIVPAGTPVR